MARDVVLWTQDDPATVSAFNAEGIQTYAWALRFSDEVRSPVNELPNLPEAGLANAQELKMANLLIETMQSEWEPERYRDTHRAKIEAVIEQKAHGETIEVDQAAPKRAVVDLMAALSASIATNEAGREGGAPSKKPAVRKAVKKASSKFSTAKKVPATKAARRKAS